MNNKYLAIGQKLVPGIYGGMGPLAHIEFERHIISICKELRATGDQFLPVWLTVSGSSTPDRTKSIQGIGKNALPHIVHFSNILKHMGADFIVATCNTAHYYLPFVKNKVGIPVVSMIEETVREVAFKYHGVKKVGLLATTGTLKTKLYQNAFKKLGVKVVTFPASSASQKAVMNAIYAKDYGIKQTGGIVSTKSKQILTKSSQKLVSGGAEVVIAGCTEISLALTNNNGFVVVDPLVALARKVVALSLGYENLETSEGISKFIFNPPD